MSLSPMSLMFVQNFLYFHQKREKQKPHVSMLMANISVTFTSSVKNQTGQMARLLKVLNFISFHWFQRDLYISGILHTFKSRATWTAWLWTFALSQYSQWDCVAIIQIPFLWMANNDCKTINLHWFSYCKTVNLVFM